MTVIDIVVITNFRIRCATLCNYLFCAIPLSSLICRQSCCFLVCSSMHSWPHISLPSLFRDPPFSPSSAHYPFLCFCSKPHSFETTLARRSSNLSPPYLLSHILCLRWKVGQSSLALGRIFDTEVELHFYELVAKHLWSFCTSLFVKSVYLRSQHDLISDYQRYFIFE